MTCPPRSSTLRPESMGGEVGGGWGKIGTGEDQGDAPHPADLRRRRPSRGRPCLRAEHPCGAARPRRRARPVADPHPPRHRKRDRALSLPARCRRRGRSDRHRAPRPDRSRDRRREPLPGDGDRPVGGRRPLSPRRRGNRYRRLELEHRAELRRQQLRLPALLHRRARDRKGPVLRDRRDHRETGLFPLVPDRRRRHARRDRSEDRPQAARGDMESRRRPDRDRGPRRGGLPLRHRRLALSSPGASRARGAGPACGRPHL